MKKWLFGSLVWFIGLLHGAPYCLPDIWRERLSPHSLNRYAFSKYSQFGEEGIIAEILKRLHIENGFFVEFGASDGIYLSNTRFLWERGWSGVMIEADKQRFQQMLQNYRDVKNIIFLNEFVTWHDDDPRGHTLDALKDTYFPSQEIDFLSIDIDGGDYYVLKGLKTRPKVICIENNLYWHPLLTKEIPEHIALQNLQQPLDCLVKLARQKGYEPVCLTINLFLVRKDLYEKFYEEFKNVPSDVVTLWRDGFRASSERSAIVEYRRRNAYVQNIEGRQFEQACPITEMF
jgi:hypothetical protein